MSPNISALRSSEKLTVHQIGPALRASLVKALLLLALPAIEFLFLRLLLKYGLGLKFGWRYLTDFDLFVPVPMATTLVLLVLDRFRPVKLCWNWGMLAFNLSLVLGFVVFNLAFDRFAALSPFSTILVWTTLISAIFITALSSRVKVKELLPNPNRWVFLPGLLIATASIYPTMLLTKFWPFFSGWAAQGSCALLGGFFSDVDCFVTAIHGPRMIIRHSALTIAVGQGCGGLEGFFLFAYLMLVLWLVVPQWFLNRQWIALFLLGAPLIYALNVARIALFFAFGVTSKAIIGSQLSVDIMLTLFHTHSGWIIFFTGIVAYLQIADRLLTAPSSFPTPAPAKQF